MFKKLFLTGFLLSILLCQLNAQSSKVEGVVLSKSDGLTIPGVSVSIKGKPIALQTDANGKFSVNAAVNDLLVFSSIGYNPQEVLVKAHSSNLKIVLEDAQNFLNEVVVTALNISKEKKSLGYSIQEVKGAQIAEARENNFIKALSGKIAGVQVTNSQGNMGSARIIIRGETSIAGNNQPLFVVDGVPVDNSQQGTGGTRDWANAIADINSEDIESVSVLKGPNAAALYGSRAAAGVILIKTKTGKGKQGIGITINSNNTFDQIALLPTYQNIYGQGADGNFSFKDGKGGGVNDGVDESWGPKMDGRLIPQFNSNGVPVPFIPHPDNVKSFFKTGYSLNNGVAIANSSDNLDYRFSYNNSDQSGITPNTAVGKNSFSLNTSYKITPELTLTANANYVRTNTDNLPSAVFRSNGYMLQFTWFGRQVDVSQLKKYKDDQGNNINWNNSYYANPYFIAYENTVTQLRDRLIGNVGLNYKITKNLIANFRTGNDYYTDRRKIRIAYGTSGTPNGSYEEDAYTVNENNTEFTLNFNKKLSGDFALDILGGGNIRSQSFQRNNQKAPRLAIPDVYTLTNSRDALISSGTSTSLKNYSLFSSAQLGFRNYAFLNLTARNDWSSTLPIDHLSYFYPSVNASLVLTDALNIQSNILTYAKIRGGWSKVGKDTDPYNLIDAYGFSAPFNGNPQLTSNGIKKNPDLKPETTTSSELGTELGFFKNRLKLDFSYYDINSSDQILSIDVSPTTGYNKQLVNAGKINNKGVELQVGINPIKTKDFSWDIDFNFSRNRSKVVELDKAGFLTSYTIGTSGTAQVLATVGQPYGTLFGTAYLKDANGNTVVNADGTPATDPSYHILGKYTPDWLGGITNRFGYKDFDLSFLIDVRHGGEIYSSTNATGKYTGILESTLQGRDAEHGGLTYTTDDRITHDDGIIVDGVTASGQKNTQIVSAQSYYKALYSINESNTYDASYVKLREVKLGYALPKKLISKVGLYGATFSLVGRNLWIIHKNAPNIDPETASSAGNFQGVESLTLPTTRSFGFNLNLKF
ncbi:SusC/RagA family TonB-linked outer membrane protein [Arcticibacter eurypsychrophilus]|uniref:SusC/RagA family TonB-linked outer membrane protein n=1 Tax=Arcticibacter eurypsychrophilus TaxID=1434752 RepID=UPI00084D5DF1|nr:SusC/RagA family TonB-linked outer membrane protein [Arcticibacter eurypsychrophilus]